MADRQINRVSIVLFYICSALRKVSTKGVITMSEKRSKALSLKEKEMIQVLHANGETYNAIAVKLKRSPHTIKGYLIQPEAKEEVEKIKDELSDMYEALSKRMLASITDDDIRKINAYQRVIASSAATDKMRLLKNQSTANISIAHRFMQLQEMAEIEDRG